MQIINKLNKKRFIKTKKEWKEMKYVLKSEANGMKVFILNCISEHLGFSFFKDTIVDM